MGWGKIFYMFTKILPYPLTNISSCSGKHDIRKFWSSVKEEVLMLVAILTP